MLEVNGRDRPGLLHDVTAAISDQGLQIASAHVTTYGVRAVDVFYVKDVFGLKVENERKLAALRDALLAALANPDETAPVQALPVPQATAGGGRLKKTRGTLSPWTPCQRRSLWNPILVWWSEGAAARPPVGGSAPPTTRQ